MKLVYLFTLFILPFSSFNESKVEWISPLEHDFGDIEQNKPVTFDFKYVNKSGNTISKLFSEVWKGHFEDSSRFLRDP